MKKKELKREPKYISEVTRLKQREQFDKRMRVLYQLNDNIEKSLMELK